MSLLLAVSQIYLPGIVRKRKLEMLFAATAEAFQVAVPSTRGLSFDDCLKLYAQFTRDQARKTLQEGRGPEVQSRMFKNANNIGQQLRKDFHIVTAEEVMRAASLVYKVLKTDFRGESSGKIVVKSCFFSAYYSSEDCRLISSLDEGLLAGLSGGSRLKFSERITEGKGCCWARLEPIGRPQ